MRKEKGVRARRGEKEVMIGEYGGGGYKRDL